MRRVKRIFKANPRSQRWLRMAYVAMIMVMGMHLRCKTGIMRNNASRKVASRYVITNTNHVYSRTSANFTLVTRLVRSVPSNQIANKPMPPSVRQAYANRSLVLLP